MHHKELTPKNLGPRERIERLMIHAAANKDPDPPGGHFDRPRYSGHVQLIRSAPTHLQLVMASVIEAVKEQSRSSVKLGDVFVACTDLCERLSVGRVPPESFRWAVTELDLYGFVRYPRESRSDLLSTRRIRLELPKDVLAEIHDVIIQTLSQQSKRQGAGVSRTQSDEAELHPTR